MKSSTNFSKLEIYFNNFSPNFISVSPYLSPFKLLLIMEIILFGINKNISKFFSLKTQSSSKCALFLSIIISRIINKFLKLILCSKIN